MDKEQRAATPASWKSLVAEVLAEQRQLFCPLCFMHNFLTKENI